jgi:hypothetical protein
MRRRGECMVTGAQRARLVLEGKLVCHSAPYSSTDGDKAHDSCFCLIKSRSATTTTTTLPAPLSSSFPRCICTCVCLLLLCLHSRRQLPSAHVPPSSPPTSPTPITRHLAARTRSCRHSSLLTCRAVIVALRTRKACLSAVRSAEFDSLLPCVVSLKTALA